MLELDIVPLKDWSPSGKESLIISGPCSAESEEQVLASAKEIAKIGLVKIFRAGVWKPRTRPNLFEGAGNEALQWLREVKKATGLLTTVEVANAKHVEDALNNNIDILWIGARTTVNPFYVQEIADALKGVDVPIMIKNPINPDIQLWIGAIERINKIGIKKIIAIHRGFHSYEKTKYRNTPQWQIPIELKTRYPNLPIICDPSHIAGKKSLIPTVSQKALDLNMCGLMIESHINPSVALSDAEQQLTPLELAELLSQLNFRKENSSNTFFINQLEELRNNIDVIDEELLQLLSKRMTIVEKIGEYKRDHNIAVFQLERWLEIIRTRSASAEVLDLDVPFIKKMLDVLHQESIRKQTTILNKKIEKAE